MNKVIVTGANGFIGKNLIQELLKKNIRVIAVVRNKRNVSDINSKLLRLVEADFSLYDKLDSLVGEKNIDAFFHLAWSGMERQMRNSYQIQISNIKSACDAAICSRNLNCRKFIFVGSTNQYIVNKTNDNPVLSPAAIYGTAKTAAQNMCASLLASTSTEFNAAFFSNVFGVGDTSKSLTNSVISCLLNKQQPKLIDGKYDYDWIYIDDAVGGLIAIAEKGLNNKLYYVGSRKLNTFKKIIENVRDIISPTANITFGEYKEVFYTDYSNFDLDALYHDTKFEVKCNFTESIRKTEEWVRALAL